MRDGDADADQASREAQARDRLLRAGAGALPRAPWLHGSQPPSAVDLIRFALWRTTPTAVDAAEAADAADAHLLAALALLPAARAEVDQLEAGLLFAARAQGLSWARISGELGLASAQAAQQRFGRVTGRVQGRGDL